MITFQLTPHNQSRQGNSEWVDVVVALVAEDLQVLKEPLYSIDIFAATAYLVSIWDLLEGIEHYSGYSWMNEEQDDDDGWNHSPSLLISRGHLVADLILRLLAVLPLNKEDAQPNHIRSTDNDQRDYRKHYQLCVEDPQVLTLTALSLSRIQKAINW